MKKSRTKEKLSIPGIKIPELLELQEYFPQIRNNLTIIFVILCIIGQIRLKFPQLKTEHIKKMDSVNYYIKTFLSKTDELVYVCAAMALRQTMMVYGNDQGEQNLMKDFQNLINERSGPASTKCGLANALNNPTNLRTYRRGIMLKMTGTLQAKPVHNPKQILKNLERVTYTEFKNLLPYKSDDINFDDIIETINDKLGTYPNPMIFNEFHHDGHVPMEENLYIRRHLVEMTNQEDKMKHTQNINDMPKFKQLAYKQILNVKQLKVIL